MISWQIIAIVTPLFFVVYQSLSKLLPKNTSVFLINAYVSLMGALVMFVIYFFTSGTKSISFNPKHLPVVLGIGTLIALGNAGIIKAYGLGAPQSMFTSIFYPLLIIYGIIFGLIFWGEKLGWYQIGGLVLVLIGLVLISQFKS